MESPLSHRSSRRIGCFFVSWAQEKSRRPTRLGLQATSMISARSRRGSVSAKLDRLRPSREECALPLLFLSETTLPPSRCFSHRLSPHTLTHGFQPQVTRVRGFPVTEEMELFLLAGGRESRGEPTQLPSAYSNASSHRGGRS